MLQHPARCGGRRDRAHLGRNASHAGDVHAKALGRRARSELVHEHDLAPVRRWIGPSGPSVSKNLPSVASANTGHILVRVDHKRHVAHLHERVVGKLGREGVVVRRKQGERPDARDQVRQRGVGDGVAVCTHPRPGLGPGPG